MIQKKILVTTGDQNGIGLEVTAKAFRSLSIPKNIQFIVFIPSCDLGVNSPKYKKILSSKTKKTALVSNLEDALHDDLKSFQIVLILSDLSPGDWVVQSALACANKRASGIVTAPISKIGLAQSGHKYLGHTDLFKKVLKLKHLRMMFLGHSFNVLLHSDHIPLKDVPKAFNIKSFEQTLRLASEFFKNDPRPFCLLGLNPHAGEKGLLGREEFGLLQKKDQTALKKFLKGRSLQFVSPDAAFLRGQWKKYSTYIALYHDQGLIPFKLVHGVESGVHLTLGLPFFRTSVDHGTAPDIFDQDIASENSMLEALKMGLLLARQI